MLKTAIMNQLMIKWTTTMHWVTKNCSFLIKSKHDITLVFNNLRQTKMNMRNNVHVDTYMYISFLKQYQQLSLVMKFSLQRHPKKTCRVNILCFVQATWYTFAILVLNKENYQYK